MLQWACTFVNIDAVGGALSDDLYIFLVPDASAAQRSNIAPKNGYGKTRQIPVIDIKLLR